MLYVIKLIKVDENEYISSEVIDSISDDLFASAFIILENNAKEFVKNEFGNAAANEAKVIQITDKNQIFEPKVDKILMYSFENEPTKIHIYQRKSETEVAAGWVFTSERVKNSFKRISIVELEMCKNIKVSTTNNFSNSQPLNNSIITVGKAGVKISTNPLLAQNTKVLLNELVNSNVFKKRYI